MPIDGKLTECRAFRPLVCYFTQITQIYKSVFGICEIYMKQKPCLHNTKIQPMDIFFQPAV